MQTAGRRRMGWALGASRMSGSWDSRSLRFCKKNRAQPANDGFKGRSQEHNIGLTFKKHDLFAKIHKSTMWHIPILTNPAELFAYKQRKKSSILNHSNVNILKWTRPQNPSPNRSKHRKKMKQSATSRYTDTETHTRLEFSFSSAFPPEYQREEISTARNIRNKWEEQKILQT